MIWSLAKILLFVGLIALLTVGAGYVIETGGDIRLFVANTEYTLAPLTGIIAVLMILAAGWIAFRLLALLIAVFRFFNGDETAISRYFDRNRERRGFEALADGLMALASGEGRLAMSKAARAEKYLGRPELTLLLSAQAAEMSGQTNRAQAYYKRLLEDDRTRFVGVQGIMKQKLAEGDTDTALKLAQKAFALKPQHGKTLDTLFALQSQKSDWQGARKTLGAKLKAKTLPKEVHTRRDAVLALADAKDKFDAGDVQAGSAAAMEANRLSPDLVPAAALAAEMHVMNNAPKQAVKLLKKAWAVAPHPELAAAFADIMPDETPAERHKRFQPLLKINPEDAETRLLAAELAIVDDDFAAARDALGDLAKDAPTTRSLTIQAAVERGLGSSDKVVRGWLTSALGASRGPSWICHKCQHIHAVWSPVCENCEGFDTLSWDEPVQGKNDPQTGSELLPLIVGSLQKDSPVADAETTDAKADQKESSVKTKPTSQAPRVVTPRPTIPTPDDGKVKTADQTDDVSDDLDGLIGDPHTVPDR